MSSTERDLEGALDRARAALASRGARLLATAPDPGAPTYFEAPRRARMEAADFEPRGAGAPVGCVESVIEIWGEEGVPELRELAEELRRVAREAEEDPPESDREVPETIYAMF